MPRRSLLHFSPHGRPPPLVLRRFAGPDTPPIVDVSSPEEVVTRVGRGAPEAVVLDTSTPAHAAIELCRAMKRDAFTAIVPVVAYVEEGGEEAAAEALEAGADEVIRDAFSVREADLRLRLALRRAARDVGVHPTTRLPGTVLIERDLAERMTRKDVFAVCYADLDHFKEFNDRYGYNHGDRVILILSRILRDVVRAHAPNGFIGHIGGDDFIFTIPYAQVDACCGDVLEVFDDLIPLQYTEEDRTRGYFHGKDRRGQTYEVPMMTLSVGIVTNHHRTFSHVGQISELATEMKAYAKTLPGSVHVIDRRTDPQDETFRPGDGRLA